MVHLGHRASGIVDHGSSATVTFTNGNSVEGVKAQIDDIQTKAAAVGRKPKIGINAFIIARDTEQEAKQVLADIERLHAEYGHWWQPAPLLQQLVREGRTFANLQN